MDGSDLKKTWSHATGMTIRLLEQIGFGNCAAKMYNLQMIYSHVQPIMTPMMKKMISSLNWTLVHASDSILIVIKGDGSLG